MIGIYDYMKKPVVFLLILFISIILISCSDSASVFVSVSGNDQGTGTLDDPFLTIERACNFIREKRATGENKSYNVFIREGDYYFTKTVELTEKDNNITILPYNNEKVRLTGGISIDPKLAEPVAGTDKEKLFQEKARAHIAMVQLETNGITNYGELHPVGFGRPIVPAWMELFVNDQPLHLSRWPNDSFIKMGKVINQCSIITQGDSTDTGGEFKYMVSPPGNWENTDDIWLLGYFNNGWADDALKLASINTKKKTFITANAHRFGFNSEKPVTRWYAYNIAFEIDTTGEYYIDRKEGMLYFYKPETIESIKLSVLDMPFMTMNGSSNITVCGITFDCTRAIAVQMYGTQDCLFSDCTFKNIGCYALEIDNDEENAVLSKNNGIVNCTICNTGSGGILLYGGNRETLEAAGNYVSNCTIHDFNRINKTYCSGVKIAGVGNHIEHNEIFNSPHAAILLKGNEHLIEYNDIHDVCKATDDVGAFYYGRDPSERGNILRYNYFHHIGKNGLRSSAIYHDDGACALTVIGNILYKAGAFPTLIGGGSDNMYFNNIFIDDSIGIKVDNRFQAFEWAKPAIAPGGIIEKRLNAIRYNQAPYSTRYPNLVKYWEEDPSFPKRNKIDGNIFVNVDKVVLKIDEGVNSDKQFLDFTDNNLITHENPGFVDMANENFALSDSSVVFKKIPGFRPIPFDEIGTIKRK